jgi:hypothetical protein
MVDTAVTLMRSMMSSATVILPSDDEDEDFLDASEAIPTSNGELLVV